MPVRIRDAPRSVDEIRGTPQPGVFSRAMSGLGKAAGYGYDLFTDPWKAAARGLAYVPEPIRRYQDTIDAPQDDGLEPETAFGYELPWNKAQTRGFKAGMLDNANLGTIAEVGAMAASGGTSGLASLATRAGLKVPGLIRGANTAARVSGQVSRASDYAGIAGGGLETVEGLREGDYGRAAVGAGMAGLGGVSRYTSQPRTDAPRANDSWTEFAQEAPERPVQTPLERVRKDQFDTLFADETPIGPAAQAVRTAAEPTPTFSPAKPRAGQSTLQPVSDLPIGAAPAGSAASRAGRARALNPRRQDPGVLPQARAGMDDSSALDQFFETGVDPLDVPPPPDRAGDDALRAMFDGETPVRPELTDDVDDWVAWLFGNEVPVAASMRPQPPEAAPVTPAPKTRADIERSFLEDLEQDARLQDGDTRDELQTLIERIAKGGGIGSMDDAILAPTRKSFRSQPRAGGELARAKREGGGFGRWGKTRGVFTPGGQHQDVWATDLLRRHPEYAGKFETGDELLQYIDDLHKQGTYRDAPAPFRPGKLPAEAGYRATPEARSNRKAKAADMKERAAIQDDGTGAMRGSTEFDPVELETGVAAEVPVPVTRPMNPELKAQIEAEVNARPANEYAAPEPFTAVAYRGQRPDSETLPGRFFTPDRATAEAYGDVTEETLTFRTPLRAQNWVEAKTAMGLPAETDMAGVLTAAKVAGHDGIVFERHNGAPEYVDLRADVNAHGEAQPRLPGDVGAVRDAEVPTPRVADAPEQAFNLAPPPVKPPAQPNLPQALPEGTPSMKPQDGAGIYTAPPEAPKAAIPTNVRDYLVKRLGWSPEAVNAMTPEQAVNAGKAQQRPPEWQGQAPKPKDPAAGSVVQAPSPLSTRDVPITKTGPRGEITVGPEAASAPATLAARATPDPAGPQSAREKGTNPRAVEQANAAGKRFVETGNDADLDTWATGVAREADEAGKQAVKAGHKVSLDGGTKIHSNPLADPELWKKAARVLTKTPAGRFYLGAVGGALVGHDQDDPWSETAKNAVLGGLAASLANRKTAKEVMAALERRRLGTGLYGERGVRPVLPEAGEKWSAWDKVRSPQRSIPDVMRKVQPKFEVAEQAIRGFDAEGKPIKDFKSALTPEEQKLAVKESLKDVRATLRSEGKRLWEGGEKQKARLVRELLSRVENRPTLLAELMGGGTGARRIDSFLAKAQYFQSLAWNMGLGRILNPTQKYFALNYVPMGAISKAKKLAKSPEGQARTDFLHVERASDDPDMLDLTFMESLAGDRFKQAQTLWERIMEKTGGNALRASDEMNRRVTYLAAADYAKEKGGVQAGKGFDKSPEAIHRWAMDVVNQTQSVVGPMGQSPYVSRIGKSVTTFTKFSTLAMELAIDAVQNPRPETLGLIAVAASMAMANKALPDDYELDLVKMFAPRAMVSLPAYGQAKNAISQASNTAQGAVERTVRTLAPDSPERYYDELFGEGGFFGGGGMGTHRHPNRYGSVDEHTGTDALARMFGVETESNSERIVESQRQRNFQKRKQAETAESNRPKNKAAKEARIKRSKSGEASKDAIRRTVPVKDRKEYDERFGVR